MTIKEEQKSRELLLLIQAIRQIREEWTYQVKKKTIEFIKVYPDLSQIEASRLAVMHKSCQDLFNRLLRLYSCIGTDSTIYEQSLKHLLEINTTIPVSQKEAA